MTFRGITSDRARAAARGAVDLGGGSRFLRMQGDTFTVSPHFDEELRDRGYWTLRIDYASGMYEELVYCHRLAAMQGYWASIRDRANLRPAVEGSADEPQ